MMEAPHIKMKTQKETVARSATDYLHTGIPNAIDFDSRAE
jgi:hypothetical protein